MIEKLTEKYKEALKKKEIEHSTVCQNKTSTLNGLPKVHESKSIRNAVKSNTAEVNEVLKPQDQTGKYVVHAEDLPRANNLPCAQRPIKRAIVEKNTRQARMYLQKGTITYAETPRGQFF